MPISLRGRAFCLRRPSHGDAAGRRFGRAGLEEDFLQRTINVDIQDATIPVIAPEDLVVTKVLAGRPKDIEDIRNVIYQQRATLDHERIRVVLRLLEEALSQSDLLPVFEKLWDESKPPV